MKEGRGRGRGTHAIENESKPPLNGCKKRGTSTRDGRQLASKNKSISIRANSLLSFHHSLSRYPPQISLSLPSSLSLPPLHPPNQSRSDFEASERGFLDEAGMM